jgi:AcrR family transcriptional regulator
MQNGAIGYGQSRMSEGRAVSRTSGGGTQATKTTRRRGAALEQAILLAAADELIESGYPGFTMDRVAARAGTSKNAIYRRWPSRASLSVAAYRNLLPSDPDDTPDTGDLRSDALALLNRANDRMTSPTGKVVRELLSSVRNEPELLHEIREQVVRAGVSPWLTILSRAAARGEIGTAALTPRVATVAVDLLRNEYALNGANSVLPDVLVDIIDQVFLPLVRNNR